MLTTAEKATLSPRDLYIAEIIEEKRARQRARAAEENDDHHVSMIAPDDLESFKGKRLTDRTPLKKRTHQDADTKKGLWELFFAAGAMNIRAQEIFDTFKDLTHSFGLAKASAALPGDPRIYQTELHEFDLARVSPQTQALLDQEANTIATRVAALEGIDDHAVRRAEQEKIVALAAEYDMMLHPRIGRYVHSEYRVADVEMKFNPTAEAQRCTHTVCVYRMRPHEGVDSKGIRVVVGDVLAQDNPAEVVVSGQHIAPALKIS